MTEEKKNESKLEKIESRIKINHEHIIDIMQKVTNIEEKLGEQADQECKEQIEESKFRLTMIENNLYDDEYNLKNIKQKLENITNLF